nr:hypothetical protein B0A51_11354 [Rachicladosporium sp. CCFEE 5018]
MKLLLSTGNIMGGGSSIRPSTSQKTNAELISSLRANFEQSAKDQANGHVNGVSNGDATPKKVAYSAWTSQDSKDEFQIPTLSFTHSALEEPRPQYDITAKLFFLPSCSTSARPAATRKALSLVLEELHMPSIDLLILSFPGVYFDEQEDCPDKLATRGAVESQPEAIEQQIEAWKTLEELKDEGLVEKLGIAEFGADRLDQFLEGTRIKPAVDQINLRDCCSVPKALLTLAKSKGVELLVHNDCSNILPRGTLRELLGPQGAGVLAEPGKTGDKRKSLHGEDVKNGTESKGLKGEVTPQWVVKYTAVVRNRGVVENKGYFACAELAA